MEVHEAGQPQLGVGVRRQVDAEMKQEVLRAKGEGLDAANRDRLCRGPEVLDVEAHTRRGDVPVNLHGEALLGSPQAIVEMVSRIDGRGLGHVKGTGSGRQEPAPASLRPQIRGGPRIDRVAEGRQDGQGPIPRVHRHQEVQVVHGAECDVAEQRRGHAPTLQQDSRDRPLAKGEQDTRQLVEHFGVSSEVLRIERRAVLGRTARGGRKRPGGREHPQAPVNKRPHPVVSCRGTETFPADPRVGQMPGPCAEHQVEQHPPLHLEEATGGYIRRLVRRRHPRGQRASIRSLPRSHTCPSGDPVVASPAECSERRTWAQSSMVSKGGNPCAVARSCLDAHGLSTLVAR